MTDGLKLKNFFVAVIVITIFILLFLGFIYVFSLKISKEVPQSNSEIVPYKVLTPDIYNNDTVVSIYQKVPPLFPQEVVLENKALDYSGSVVTGQGKTQITVSYISDKSTEDTVALYTTSLPLVGWSISNKSIYTKVSVIKATKGGQSILISIASLQKGGTMVTFQYEK